MLQVDKGTTSKTSPHPKISFIKLTCLGRKWEQILQWLLGCAHLNQADRWPCETRFNSSFGGYAATGDSTWVCGEQELCHGKVQLFTS